MILKTRKHNPKEGTVRTKSKFLWKPTWFEGEGQDTLHWLETTTVKQVYSNNRWINSSQETVIIKSK